MNNKNNSAESSGSSPQSRREFMYKAIYVSPVLLTLPATPSFAQQGSGGNGGDPGGIDPCMVRPPPIGSGPIHMCRLQGEENGRDIFIEESEVEEEIARFSVFGSCDDFFCNAS